MKQSKFLVTGAAGFIGSDLMVLHSFPAGRDRGMDFQGLIPQ